MGGTFTFARFSESIIYILYKRVTAPAGKSARCKVGVIAEATAELKVTIPAADLPYDENFHPKTLNPYYRESKPESKRLGHPLLATNIIPYANQVQYQ